MATILGNGTITFGDGTTLSSASMIQSIQRGSVTGFSPGGAVNISAVVTSKCMVIIQGLAYAGYYAGPIYFTAFNSTTQFAWASNSQYPYSSTSNFGWQVIEFK